jgi:phosphoesterase RecJ-like protein
LVADSEEVETDSQILIGFKPDLIIVLDSGSLAYAGVEALLTNLNHQYQLINIDHHSSNAGYGALNYLDERASSTCEIIYTLLRTWQVPLNKNIATSLLNGIMTDTGMLTNPATTDNSLLIASQLMKFGANIQKITDRNLRNKSADMLKLWGVALERLTYNPDLHSVTTGLTRDDFEKFAITSSSLEGLANFLSQLNNVNFTLVLVEQADDTIKGSFRTTRDDVDVGALAAELGGGGHRKAAGFTIPGRLVYNNGEIQII